VQGLGGLMSVTGHPEHSPGGGPMKVGVALVDVMTGLNATVAVLAALQERQRSGLGQHIDIALLDVQVAALANQAANYLVGGQLPARMGNAHPNIVPYQDFPTADGHMILTVGNDAQFARFAEAAGHPEWVMDDRFRTNAARVRHRQELVTSIREATRIRTTGEWIAVLEAAGVPCGPINNLEQVFDDPQVRARELRVTLPGPNGADAPGVASPLRLSRTPVTYRHGAPALGAHTASVLREWLGPDFG
jgi:crotonobetainyl-CoA:carnitine CoA-transferase CaiB-like acyl-CoA transferase